MFRASLVALAAIAGLAQGQVCINGQCYPAVDPGAQFQQQQFVPQQQFASQQFQPQQQFGAQFGGFAPQSFPQQQFQRSYRSVTEFDFSFQGFPQAQTYSQPVYAPSYQPQFAQQPQFQPQFQPQYAPQYVQQFQPAVNQPIYQPSLYPALPQVSVTVINGRPTRTPLWPGFANRSVDRTVDRNVVRYR